jgi:soluble lytic murein transglycosylase
MLTLTVSANVSYMSYENRTTTVQDIIHIEANKYKNVSVGLVNAIIKTESQFNPKAVSEKGAIGLMQLMDCAVQDYNRKHKTKYTHKQMLYPVYNIKIGVWYLSQRCIKKHGFKNGISAFFWGPWNTNMTEKYYNKVKGYL